MYVKKTSLEVGMISRGRLRVAYDGGLMAQRLYRDPCHVRTSVKKRLEEDTQIFRREADVIQKQVPPADRPASLGPPQGVLATAGP